VADKDHKEDHQTNPGTEAFTPDFSDDDDAEDTGTQSWTPDFSDDTGSQPIATPEPGPAVAAAEPATEAASEPVTETAGAPVQPVTVPGRYLYLKWWQLVLVLFGVWVVAGVLGLGLFYWWFHSVHKTPAVFVVLVYVVACVVGGVLLAMIEGRSVVAALSLAVMSGPFASVAAAAPLYGYYFCERVGHCLVGVVPY
jgi:hypothetical protein